MNDSKKTIYVGVAIIVLAILLLISVTLGSTIMGVKEPTNLTTVKTQEIEKRSVEDNIITESQIREAILYAWLYYIIWFVIFTSIFYLIAHITSNRYRKEKKDSYRLKR